MIKLKANFTIQLFFLIILVSFFSCSKSNMIYLKKINKSPKYESSKLTINKITKNEDDYTFSFNVDNYELGIQTPKTLDFNLANSAKGQHIHFIVNNGPYSAHYNDNFETKLNNKNNLILAFLSRSYHESVKNNDAFVLTQTGEENQIDLSSEFLFYSRPKGVYKGDDTKKLLFDFYLVNTDLSPNGNNVKLTIKEKTNIHQFLIDSWEPYYIEGLQKGEVSFKIELINKNGKAIETPFNPSERVITLE